MLMLNNGICKYGKETKNPTGRNVAIFDFRFRENIFFFWGRGQERGGKQRATYWPTTIEVRTYKHTHTLARILVCMHISYRMSLPNRKSTCVRLKCFCTYFYCECLSNFPAFTSSFPFALFFLAQPFQSFFFARSHLQARKTYSLRFNKNEPNELINNLHLRNLIDHIRVHIRCGI